MNYHCIGDLTNTMSCAEQVFHNLYIREEIFSHSTKRYRDLDCYHQGNFVAKKGVLKLLVLKAEFENDLNFTIHAMDLAAMNGHLPVVQWLHANRTEGCTTDAMDWAAMNGHLETVEWLHANRREGCTTRAMDYAANSGHLSTVQWLHANRREGCTTRAMDYAANSGLLHVVQWLHTNRYGCTEFAMNDAAFQGRLDVVQWLYANRTEGIPTNALKRAINNNQAHVVKWLQETIDNSCY